MCSAGPGQGPGTRWYVSQQGRQSRRATERRERVQVSEREHAHRCRRRPFPPRCTELHRTALALLPLWAPLARALSTPHPSHPTCSSCCAMAFENRMGSMITPASLSTAGRVRLRKDTSAVCVWGWVWEVGGSEGPQCAGKCTQGLAWWHGHSSTGRCAVRMGAGVGGMVGQSTPLLQHHPPLTHQPAKLRLWHKPALALPPRHAGHMITSSPPSSKKQDTKKGSPEC